MERDQSGLAELGVTDCKNALRPVDISRPQIERFADPQDDQPLEPDTFSQWDWNVTPRKHGPLHLLLYVAPMLYVDGIGEETKQFRQPPRVITVVPDYIYESGAFLKENWPILSGLLTVVFTPLFLWLRSRLIDSFKKPTVKKPGLA